MKKIIYISLGMLTFILGTIGVFVPFLPTTPFYLATAFFWVNSSERLHQYLLRNKYYHHYVQEMVIEKKLTRKNQFTMLLVLFMLLSIPFLLVDNLLMRIALILVYIGHLIFLPRYFKQPVPPAQKESLNDR